MNIEKFVGLFILKVNIVVNHFLHRKISLKYFKKDYCDLYILVFYVDKKVICVLYKGYLFFVINNFLINQNLKKQLIFL